MAGETTQSPGQYMRGSCFALALYLADRSDFTLFGLFDEAGAMHHAFVANPETGTAFDGRGRTSMSGVLRFRGLPCAGQQVRPVERALVATYAEEARTSPWTAFDPSDAEIRRFVQRGGFPTLRRKKTAIAA
jgi:hypothetical protein